MDLCKFDVPLLKRIPTDEASHFATVWGHLLDEAVYSGSEVAWSEFFLFPKVILWAPPVTVLPRRQATLELSSPVYVDGLLSARNYGWRLWIELANDLWSRYRNPSQGGRRQLWSQLYASET